MAMLAGLLLLFIVPGNHGATHKSDSTVIEGVYQVQITELPDVPKFLSGFFGKVAQFLDLAPDKLDYRETVLGQPETDDFRIELKDQTGRQWIHFSSDTALSSFIDPPEFRTGTLPKAKLKPDAIRFIVGIRDFFIRDRGSFFHGRFVLWGDTVDFYSTRDSLRPLLYRFSSFNRKGKLVMKGVVLRGSRDGFVIYPWTNLYLYKEETGLILELKSLEIK